MALKIETMHPIGYTLQFTSEHLQVNLFKGPS